MNTNTNLQGIGLAFTLGKGNDLVCKAVQYLASDLVGKDIEQVMHSFGSWFRKMADEPQLRWLGPHKGVVHLALASITNACFDLWAKSREVPLWKLLVELSPADLVATLDLTYLEEIMNQSEALDLLNEVHKSIPSRMGILERGYEGYDTSVGWFHYEDQIIIEKTKESVDQGFAALKLKVGSKNPERDIRRAQLIRDTAGENVMIMLDANQQWNLPTAISICKKLTKMNPLWIEEPTHPDDVIAHQMLAQKIHPVKLAMGEHVPNRILFKNYLQSGSMGYNQVDAVRVGGISEFITISLLSKKYNVPVVPHVGDMGQIHQHLVLFNHIYLGHEALFLEYIPHLKGYFKFPAKVWEGRYQTPQEPGSSSDLKKY